MALVRKKTKKEQTAAVRRKRRQQAGADMQPFSLWRFLLGLATLIGMTFAVSLICFVGQNPAGPRLLEGQTARFRVTAQIPFSYTSEIQTRRQIERRKQRIRPSYRIDMTAFEEFERDIAALNLRLDDELEPQLAELNRAEWGPVVETFAQEFAEATDLMVNPDDLLLFMDRTTSQERANLISEGLLHLKEILRDGVYEEEPGAEISDLTVLEIVGRTGRPQLEVEQDAASTLSISLTGLGDDLQVSRALFRLLKRGLEPNLVFDSERHNEKLQRLAESVEPVVVRVPEGEVLVEPGIEISREHIETLDAYREALVLREAALTGVNVTLAKRLLMTVVLLCCAALFWSTAFDWRPRNYQRMLLACTVLLLNLALFRLVDEASEFDFFNESAFWLEALPFAAPLSLSAILVCIMLGPRQAILAALVTSVLYGIMRGNSMAVFLISLLSCMVGIYFSRDVRLRGRVVRAGAMAGLTVALVVTFNGLANEIDPLVYSQQAAAGLAAGIFAGVFAVGLLPVLEQMFKFTTDITLLELTDFNHPLLRKLQLKAPGTYHHSLMVANLSERAASLIGANTTLCRAACLYHDIGKMVKPEFFVENQQAGINPHDDISPSMSALILKNHVKEGVQMAQEARLPRVIVDVIEQHHGTTLIRYFFVKAVERCLQAAGVAEAEGKKPPSEAVVDEEAFRYDGPRPRTRENGIIFLADAVEAASRSLKKVTPQNIEELVDKLIDQRMDDGQLRDCPLTFRELMEIRDSFCFSLKNMLHSRVEYPNMKKERKKEGSQTQNPIQPIAVEVPAKQSDGPTASDLGAGRVDGERGEAEASGTTGPSPSATTR